MAKGLRNMTVEEERKAIKRRLKDKTGGLGYWAARDALRIILAKVGRI